MTIVSWSDSYSLGVERIDVAHRQLFEMLERLHAELLGQRKKSVIDQLLDELVEYTRTHFAEEEAFMLKCQEPSIEQHRAAHRALEKRLGEIAAAWRKGDGHASVDFFGFLFGDWLWRHIMETDMKIGKHVRD